MPQKIQNLPWLLLLPFAAFMLLVPFHPQPHLWEKFHMLRNRTLTQPLDIFDVLWHSWPTALVIAKLVLSKQARQTTD